MSSAQDSVNNYAVLLNAKVVKDTANSVAMLGGEIRKTLVSLLREIDGPSYRMTDQLKGIEDHLHSNKRLEVLTWMSAQPYKAYHNQNRRDILEGSGHWLLEDPIFKKWKRDSASSLSWLRGSSGTGKTKLIAIVIEDLFRQYKEGQITLPAYFYCSRNTQENLRSDPEAILASLARQLSSLEPGTPIHNPSLQLFSEKESEGFASGGLAMEESVDLISQLTEYYPITTVVLDALDECNADTRYRLLDAIEQILRQSKGLVKILASSREEGDIVYELRDYPSLKVSSDRNSKNIKAFLKAEIVRLVAKKSLLRHSSEGSKPKLQLLIERSLMERACGM